MAAPTWKSATHANFVGTSGAIVLPNTGDGAAAGDFAILTCTLTPGAGIATPAGWTDVPNCVPTTATASAGKTYAWTKTFDAGDLGATLTLTPDASSRVAIGCITTSPATLDATPTKDETNTSGTSVTAPSITSVTADTLMVCIFGCISNTAGVTITWTAPGSMTERVDESATSGTLRNGTLLISTETLSVAGATGTRTATSSANVQRQGISFVLAEATSGSVPYVARRDVQLRDPGEAWWSQRDRRDALLVATTADPLVAPLDSAWQAGAQYWQLYNTAATHADRRLVPQQRAYLSVPGSLDPPAADPLLLATAVGGDLWRRYNAAAYGDRREVPQQPPRWSLYFDGGPGTPPLTLAWGVGGDLWHRYQWRRPARSWWPPPPLLALVMDTAVPGRLASTTAAASLTGATTTGQGSMSTVTALLDATTGGDA